MIKNVNVTMFFAVTTILPRNKKGFIVLLCISWKDTVLSVSYKGKKL
jgi:hypothetical protein